MQIIEFNYDYSLLRDYINGIFEIHSTYDIDIEIDFDIYNHSVLYDYINTIIIEQFQSLNFGNYEPGIRHIANVDYRAFHSYYSSYTHLDQLFEISAFGYIFLFYTINYNSNSSFFCTQIHPIQLQVLYF